MQCPNLTLCLLLLLLVESLSAANRRDLAPDRPPDRSFLTECRPEPVSAKLDAVGRVLHVLGWDNVCEVIVIDVPQAWTGLYERAVLLVSVPALDLLSATGLQDVVGHEAGHEYLFREYEAASLTGDLSTAMGGPFSAAEFRFAIHSTGTALRPPGIRTVSDCRYSLHPERPRPRPPWPSGESN